jgi:hypothetical protein
LRLQKFLGLPLSSFRELDRYGEGWVNEELNSQLREEELAGWGLDDEEEEDNDPWKSS